MKKKLLSLLTGTLLSGVILVGCNNDDTDTNNNLRNVPEPTVDTPNNNLNRNDLDNYRYRNNNIDDNDNDGIIDNNNRTNDRNTDTDKDPAKDNNTPREEIIEDDLDARDKDNKDR
ncbi:hypothetical protein [Neobacillus muris]|uniref:hypothetical protein n=1 Tax=Neobacillus muris TaxID=2941334 RepID=UPI00203A67AE|nr:hypothetical protein [Neobacillus muris]